MKRQRRNPEPVLQARSPFWGLVMQNGPWPETPEDVARKSEKDIKWEGGGVPAGGREHAGHAEWYAQMQSVSGQNFGSQTYIPAPPPMNVTGNGALKRSTMSRSQMAGYEYPPGEKGSWVKDYGPGIASLSGLGARILYDNPALFAAVLAVFHNAAAAAFGGLSEAIKRARFGGVEEVPVATRSRSLVARPGAVPPPPGTTGLRSGEPSVVQPPHDSQPTSDGGPGRRPPAPEQAVYQPTTDVLRPTPNPTGPPAAAPPPPPGFGGGGVTDASLAEALQNALQNLQGIKDGIPTTTNTQGAVPEVQPEEFFGEAMAGMGDTQDGAFANLVKLAVTPDDTSFSMVQLVGDIILAAVLVPEGRKAIVDMVGILYTLPFIPPAVGHAALAIAEAARPVWTFVTTMLNPEFLFGPGSRDQLAAYIAQAQRLITAGPPVPPA